MIQKYIDRFMANKKQLESKFKIKHPKDYKELVQNTVEIITSNEYSDLDPTRIKSIDYGDYQGTLVYIIAAKGYQSSDYWTVKINYGSCSGCDTLQGITNYSSKVPTESQIKAYVQLCLHIVQQLKQI